MAAELDQLKAERRHRVTLTEVEAKLDSLLADWRSALHRNVAEARQMLRTVLASQIRFVRSATAGVRDSN